MFLKLDHIKAVANFATGAAVTKVVHDIIENNTDPEDLVDKAKVIAGSAVLGSMVADAASDHVNARIDATATWIANMKHKKTATE